MYRDSASQTTTRWEYRTLVSPDVTRDPDMEKQLGIALNELGRQGWEAISASVNPSGVAPSILFLLKRQAP